MIFPDAISWPHFVQLAHIRNLSLHEQMQKYNYYLMEQQALYVHAMQTQMTAHQSVGGGAPQATPAPEPEPPVTSNCIEFTADTTIGGTTFEVFVTSTGATTATIDWGDGVIEDDVEIVGNEDTKLTHTYAEEDTAYNVTMCFADPSFITELDFSGDD